MNTDILEGKWKQVRGDAKRMWGKLTDDELDEAQGNLEKLAGAIQERYGYTREEAKREIDRFRRDVESKYNK
ncbi:MAG: CsbD family protein [Chloroflexi bacterium]|nr:CsbD family protein [Anaerolineaceae bacterium]NMB88536.1 CsbD family protein [Chloroflexota bacterium]